MGAPVRVRAMAQTICHRQNPRLWRGKVCGYKRIPQTWLRAVPCQGRATADTIYLTPSVLLSMRMGRRPRVWVEKGERSFDGARLSRRRRALQAQAFRTRSDATSYHHPENSSIKPRGAVLTWHSCRSARARSGCSRCQDTRQTIRKSAPPPWESPLFRRVVRLWRQIHLWKGRRCSW